jgi:hypothetical protein
MAKKKFIDEAVGDILDGVEDVFSGKLFDFDDGTPVVKENKDGDKGGNSGIVPGNEGGNVGGKSDKRDKPGKSAADKLSDAFSTPAAKKEGETSGKQESTEGTDGTKSGDTK